ncbi:MAG: PaaI family thioesterase [Gammaproteobacteria bacterium]|nr:PaaI family thioesterase [Gammaproteobacteria bacterium]
MPAPRDTNLTVQEFNRIADARLPFAALMGLRAESIDFDGAVMRAVHRDDFLRPGGSIAGPIMMGLADAAFYAAILGNIGAVELAVTTNFSMHFLRKPPPGDILAHARLLKLGKRLAVCEATLCSEALGDEQPVAHATGTYSIPQDAKKVS